LLFVLGDAAEQVLEVGGGVVPAERAGGAVMALDEGEQGLRQRFQAGEVAGPGDLLLDDAEENLD
jgi:hypothetical protein